MKKMIWGVLAALAMAVGMASSASAQSACKYITGDPDNVLTASQWNWCFQQKNDNLGFTPFNAAGGVLTGKLITAPPTTSISGFNLPPGIAPLAPKDGDFWTTTAGVYAQINGSTIGPIGSGIPSSASANRVFAGPVSGGAAAPAFRALVAADLPMATSSALGAVQPDGTTIAVSGGGISARTATTSLLGIVKPDNSTVTITTGTLSVPTATTSVVGLVKPDNTSITISGGVLTATTANPGYNQQTFTSGGTFTTPANSTTSTVYHYRIQAGGGGGGGNNAASGASGGGGSGAYAEGTFTGISPSTGITITVGAAGTAGGSTGTNGGNGGVSSIGAPVSISCSAGGGAVGNSSSTVTVGGAGGVITGTPNMLSVPGQKGESGLITNSSPAIIGGGNGGSSPLGSGGIGGQSVTSGPAQTAAVGYGAGGAGGLGSSSGASAGAQGIVVIDWVL